MAAGGGGDAVMGGPTLLRGCPAPGRTMNQTLVPTRSPGRSSGSLCSVQPRLFAAVVASMEIVQDLPCLTKVFWRTAYPINSL